MEYAWLWWLGAGLVLAICEVLGAEFVFLMLAGACLVGSGVALGTENLVVQVAAAAVSAVVLLLLVRPWLRARVMSKVPDTRMGAVTVVGEQGTITEEVTDHTGLVRLEGGTWTARPARAGDLIAPGQRVQVMAIDGATALVTAVTSAN